MRVLVVNWQDRLNPQAGGAEVHLHEIFGRLAEQGNEIHFLVSGFPGAAPEETVDGIRVHRTGSRYTFGVRAPRHYRRALRRRDFGIVVEALNKVPVFTPRWAGAPTALLVHHLFGATAFREAPWALAGATWLLERPIPSVYRNVPVETISRSTAEDLVRRGLDPARIRVIHPGVDLEFFCPGGARSEVPLFVYVGRLRRYKGVELLLRATAGLRADGVHAEVRIAGRGEHEPALRRLCGRLGLGEQVRFLGFVSEAAKRELFRTAWANVFPSPKEGWGITNVEAGACGTPSVASDAPGLRESVIRNGSGLLFPVGDAEALRHALRRLATDPGEVERLGRGARSHALSFSWDNAARATEEHLESIIAGAT